MAYLKWAGGKRSLIENLMPLLLPERDSAIFYDAFAGSGTVGEAMANHASGVILNDSNRDVCNVHQCVLEYGEEFIKESEKLFVDDTNNTDAYYELRDRFNMMPWTIERSALFVYLNRHGFNGLCRFNSEGEFNVPFGKYKSPSCPSDQMREFRRSLKGKTAVTLLDFSEILADASPGDVVYCDPPYYPLSATSNFTNYGAGSFTIKDQERLADAARMCNARVVISNHDLPQTRELYAGADIIEVSVPGSISAKAGSRGTRNEIIAIFE